jgi:hypothetical protein
LNKVNDGGQSVTIFIPKNVEFTIHTSFFSFSKYHRHKHLLSTFHFFAREKNKQQTSWKSPDAKNRVFEWAMRESNPRPAD